VIRAPKKTALAVAATGVNGSGRRREAGAGLRRRAPLVAVHDGTMATGASGVGSRGVHDHPGSAHGRSRRTRPTRAVDAPAGERVAAHGVAAASASQVTGSMESNGRRTARRVRRPMRVVRGSRGRSAVRRRRAPPRRRAQGDSRIEVVGEAVIGPRIAPGQPTTLHAPAAGAQDIRPGSRYRTAGGTGSADREVRGTRAGAPDPPRRARFPAGVPSPSGAASHRRHAQRGVREKEPHVGRCHRSPCGRPADHTPAETSHSRAPARPTSRMPRRGLPVASLAALLAAGTLPPPRRRPPRPGSSRVVVGRPGP